MTATPKVFKGDSDTEIASMDSEEIYGKLIDEITVKDAINGINKFKLLKTKLLVDQELTMKIRIIKIWTCDRNI